jgi:hypothetical protein
MNGQPTAQNTRECGADGDLPGFRNWHDPDHIDELARLWNVDPMTIPHWAPPTHAMQIWRHAEQGSIKLLWISGTNPAVSLPELARIRAILEAPEPFVVVQDAFLTETARRADRGGLGLLRDLHDLYLMATECEVTWALVGQAAQGARDRDLLEVSQGCDGEVAAQLKWLRTRMKQAAPQALLVAD